MASTLKIRVDENDADNVNKGKKTVTENIKRAAFGDLKNRAVSRTNVLVKETAAKDLKDVIRSTKARVDTHWKKAPRSESESNGTARTQTNVANKTSQRQVLTRANSVRLDGNKAALATTSGLTKPKTLIAKVVENKVQHVKHINKTKPENPAAVVGSIVSATTLRREDSNLARKSLTKLKAAFNRDATAKPIAPKTTTGTSSVRSCAKFPAVKSDIKIVSVQTYSSKFLNEVEDIDAGDKDNLMLVSEYVNDIYDYLFTLETENDIRPNHLDGQEEVFPKMRAVLIDWINEVHLQFQLNVETFQMAVAIIDRYLQIVKNTKRSHLQLVGVTALCIAAKYEELMPPAINDFVYITDDTYDAKQILRMELKILKALDCNLSRPLPIHFLRRFSKAANAEECHHNMSKYFLELASIEYEFAGLKPSEVAAASLFLALHLLKEDANKPTGFNNALWTPTLEWYSRCSADFLRPLTKKIAAIVRNAATAKLKAVYTKYQSSKLRKISLRSELTSVLMDSIVNSKD